MPSPRKSTSAPQMGASPIRALVLPLVLTALVLSPVLFADFVRLDDYTHRLENRPQQPVRGVADVERDGESAAGELLYGAGGGNGRLE